MREVYINLVGEKEPSLIFKDNEALPDGKNTYEKSNLNREKIIIKGVSGIRNVTMRKDNNNFILENKSYVQKSEWVLDTTGVNLLEIFSYPGVDYTRTISNDIYEIYETLGIEAARQVLMKEIKDVINASDYVNYRHMSLLCDIKHQATGGG